MEQLIIDFGIPAEFAKFIVMFILAFALINFMAVISGLLTLAERRIAGRMQSRIGPNRVGPQGLLQWIADAVKLLLKEDIIPDGADRLLFKIAPFLGVMGVFGTFVVLPWGSGLVPFDLNIGLLYLISITALVVIGMLMAGWASNNKWSLLGGMRSAAQVVSYEIPVAMGLLPPILIAGSLSMSGLMAAQGWAPWDWIAFQNPFSLLAFFVFFIGSLAEGNRTPFDLPEAEAELVAGYFTEYSGFRFAIFSMAEFANIWVIAALTTAVFLGGGNLPDIFASNTALTVIVFLAKTFSIMFVVIWIRWTLPRFRIDQMMELSWKYLLPTAFIAFFGQAILTMLTWDSPLATKIIGILTFATMVVVFLQFCRRVIVNRREQATTVRTR